jgi:hypothetical protein
MSTPTEPNVIRVCPVCSRRHVVPLSQAPAYFANFDGAQCPEHPRSPILLKLDQQALDEPHGR